MALITATTVFFALLFLCGFFSHTEAYVIDKSCQPYVTDNVDKTSMIEAAMAEANEMMTHAAWMLNQNSTRLADNSREVLFQGARTRDLINIAERFTYAANNVPWTVTDISLMNLDSLIIHCGDHNFSPDLAKAPSAWKDMSSAYTVYGFDYDENDNVKLCTRNTLAMMLGANGIAGGGNVVKLILLCESSLVQGVARHSTGSQFGVMGIAAQPGKAGFYPGKRMDEISSTTCLSATLLHELMHVTQWDRFFSCDAEIHGWDGIAALSINWAMSNIDNYAFYALAMFLPPEYFVYDGIVGSHTQLLSNINPFRYLQP